MGDESGESTPPRPRRRIRNIVVMSSSGSESDDSGPATSMRKKRLRVLSDSDEGSSGSSIAVGRRRKRVPPKLRDSDFSDSSGWETDRSTAAPRAPTASQGAKPTSGFASDSSEGNSDKCSICLMRFTDQQVGTPQTCEHIFCLDCITEWSRNVNTCPVDRMSFDSIVVRENAGGRVLSTQPVQVVERPPSVDLFLVQETSCEICGSSGSEDTMLLCDGCDLGFHMECLTPPLTEIPINQWLCPGCSDRLDRMDMIPALEELFSEEEQVGGNLPWRRLVSRARRLRQRPAAGERSRGGAPDAPSTSRARAPPASTRTRTRNRARKRRRTTTVIIEYDLEENGKQPITKRLRRKIKRRKSTKRVPRTAARRAHVREVVRTRLAAERAAAAGGAACALGARRALAAAPTLHLFGSTHDLPYFSDEEGAPERGAGGVALASRARPDASTLAAFRQARRKMVTVGPAGAAAAAPDLLSSILESQARLHSPRGVLSVGPGGAVRVEVRGGGGAPVRQAPSYGHGRGGGGWGGGYRYPAERAPPPRHAHDNGYGHGGSGPARGPHPAHPSHPAHPAEDGFHPYERWRYHDEPYGRERRSWPPPRAAPPHRPPLGYGRDKPVPPLPEPPTFPLPEEEDERSDSSLVIDTDKYDPTEPTDDDDPAPGPLAPPASLAAVESILARAQPPVAPAPLHSPHALLHSPPALLHSPPAPLHSPGAHDSDEPGEGGDCPNFSIYSATSVHIASGSLQPAPPPAPSPSPSPPHDEEPPEAPPTPPPPPPPAPPEEDARRHSAEYKERVSRRCPITTNTRDPIKIKLNSPALLRRGGAPALLDDEEAAPEGPASEEPLPKEPLPEKSAPEESAPEEPPDGAPSLERAPDTPGDDEEPAPEQEAERLQECASRDPSEGRDTDGSGGRSRGERTPSAPGEELPGQKMTESISETEDERSYTPCLDEQREGGALHLLDTELISEDDGDGLFSEEERRDPPPHTETHTPAREGTPPPTPSPTPTPTPTPSPTDTGKKKKKKEKETKREGKERKGKKRTEVAFKKSGKAKGRKYRAREGSSPPGAGSPAARRRGRGRRGDLARYDVRSVLEGRRRTATKDAFGRDVSPPAPRTASPSPSPSPASSPRARARASPSSPPPPRRPRLSPSPRRVRALSPRRIRASPSPRRVRASLSPRRTHGSPSPRKVAGSPSPRRVRRSPSPRRARGRSSPSPAESGRAGRRRRRSPRRRSPSRRKRRRSDSAPPPKPKEKKKKKRARSHSGSRHKSPKRKRVRRRSPSPEERAAWSPRPPSPRTPPPLPPPPVPIEARRLRKRRDRSKHRRPDTQGPSKEVFTSGDNILVSVSFKESEGASGGAAAAARRERRERRRARRERAQLEPAPPKPVAIIDLERSPFRELTPSPERVIVLSDDERGPAAGDDPPPPEAAPAAGAGPKTPPEPSAPAAGTPPEPPDSPDAYDPYEPTASPPAPAPHPAPEPLPEPARLSMTLETAQKTNMSADEVIDRRPLEPIEKVMALLQSTRDAPPDPPPEVAQGAPPAAPPAPAPGPPPPRVVLPEPANKPKLFLGKPSPIKSDPIKPMQQATKISRLPLPAVRGESPYSPGSSDFGDLFEPPAAHHDHRDVFDALFDKAPAPRARRKNNRKKKGKSQQVDVRLDDDHLKVLEELPSSAVEMQVKSKFLKKLNRQERVVEEVKLVLKPHYNKKHVTKEEYKHILRRAVPKICHNKTGEINPSKIQALVEAYVKKFRKKHKLGLS